MHNKATKTCNMHKVMDHAKFPFDHWSVMDQLLCHAVHNKVKHAASTKSWIMFHHLITLTLNIPL